MPFSPSNNPMLPHRSLYQKPPRTPTNHKNRHRKHHIPPQQPHYKTHHPVLLIPNLLFHDNAGLELYLYPVRRDYFDAGNQPSDKVVIKFRYLTTVSAQESIHILHPLFIVFSQLFFLPLPVLLSGH